MCGFPHLSPLKLTKSGLSSGTASGSNSRSGLEAEEKGSGVLGGGGSAGPGTLYMHPPQSRWLCSQKNRQYFQKVGIQVFFIPSWNASIFLFILICSIDYFFLLLLLLLFNAYCFCFHTYISYLSTSRVVGVKPSPVFPWNVVYSPLKHMYNVHL